MNASWTASKLDDLTSKIGSGATPRGGKSSYKTEGVSLVRSMNVHDGTFKEKNLAFIDDSQAEKLTNVTVEENDVLLNITGASIARCCVVPCHVLPARVNQHVSILRPLKNTLDSKFLAYLLISRNYKSKLLISGNKAGATREALTKSQLQNFEIFYPSLPEQKRIVAILDQAFADIDKARANAEQNLKNSRELFESYLQQVFSQRGEGAEMVALAEITESISDGDHSAPPKSAEGIPFITISNIDKSTNEIDFSNTFKVPEGYYSQLKTTRKPKLGDVLYTVTGSYGIPVVVREEKEFCFQRHIGLIRPNKDIDSHWLYYLLMSPQVFKQADEGATGTAQKTVSLKLLRSLIVPKVPLDIQVDMREDLDFMYTKTKKLESIYQVKLNSLDELKKSILQKAFSGELTKNDSKGAAA